MPYKLSIDALREKFGDIYFVVLSQEQDKRTSCVRRTSDDRILAYSEVFYYKDGLELVPDSILKRINSGEPLGAAILESGIEHERIADSKQNFPISDELKKLFATSNSFCFMRTINYTVQKKTCFLIHEFYNPEFIPEGF